MRLQPIGTAQVSATVDTSASTPLEWIKEWLHLISYGPTYNRLDWKVPANSEATVRFEVTKPMTVYVNWSDPSVSWDKYETGKWSIDIAKAIDVTIYLKAEVGQYNQTRTFGKPAQVKSVQLNPYIEIACDDDIPFVIEKQPVAHMFWSPQINLEHIVNPNET